jgi:hypothetical protein
LIFIYFNMFQIRTKCHSKRNDIAASIRHAVFASFGERLDHINNNASAAKIVKWKSSERTKAAYKALFSESELLDIIGHAVFKQYRNKDLPTTHCTYIIAGPRTIHEKITIQSLRRMYSKSCRSLPFLDNSDQHYIVPALKRCVELLVNLC